jgi:hypothetical protein
MVSAKDPHGRIFGFLIGSTFRKVVFSSYLELRTLDKIHNPSDSWCYAPSLEPFRLIFIQQTFPSEYISSAGQGTGSCFQTFVI